MPCYDWVNVVHGRSRQRLVSLISLSFLVLWLLIKSFFLLSFPCYQYNTALFVPSSDKFYLVTR